MDILYQGLIETIPTDPRDYILGSTSKLPRIIYQTDRNWLAFKPVKEDQKKYFDTYGCVSFSRNNCLEIMEKRKYGTQFNRSDRFLVVASGTIPRMGNSMDKVALTGHKTGSVEEQKYPFTATMTQDEYYQPIPQELYAEGLKYKDVYTDQYEWVSWGGADKNKVFEALQYGPLQISIQAYGAFVNGVFQPTGNEDTNHLVTLMRWDAMTEPMYILDHYDFEIKKLHPDYYIGACMRHNIERKNTMLTLVKGEGKEIYIKGVDGTLYHLAGPTSWDDGVAAGFWTKEYVTVPQIEIELTKKGKPFGFGTEKSLFIIE